MKLSSDFRQSARDALRGKWGLAVITGILASLLGASTHGGGGLGFEVSGLNNSEIETEINFPADFDFQNLPGLEEIFPSVEPAFWAIMGTVFAVALAFGLVLGVAFFILGSIISPGYAKFNLNLVDGENADLGDLFKYFKYWKNVVLANLLRSVYIFLWSLLCFIPGIIATYTYAMVPYIMAENPELTAREACDKSKEMMDGNRLRLFCLTFSFIGWAILCAFTCGIGNIVLTAYIEAAIADFYREISDTRPIPEPNESIPVYIPESQL